MYRVSFVRVVHSPVVCGVVINIASNFCEMVAALLVVVGIYVSAESIAKVSMTLGSVELASVGVILLSSRPSLSFKISTDVRILASWPRSVAVSPVLRAAATIGLLFATVNLTVLFLDSYFH
jgi:hypothetical protein